MSKLIDSELAELVRDQLYDQWLDGYLTDAEYCERLRAIASEGGA